MTLTIGKTIYESPRGCPPHRWLIEAIGSIYRKDWVACKQEWFLGIVAAL
jgi:hypothetical protein